MFYQNNIYYILVTIDSEVTYYLISGFSESNKLVGLVTWTTCLGLVTNYVVGFSKTNWLDLVI